MKKKKTDKDFSRKSDLAGLCYFGIHDPTMHDACINYTNKLKLCRENYATGKLNFAEQKTELLLRTSVSPLHHPECSIVF